MRGRKKLEQISSVKLFKTVRNCLLLLLYSPSFTKQLDQQPKQELFPDHWYPTSVKKLTPKTL
jgi:hypothetical protein